MPAVEQNVQHWRGDSLKINIPIRNKDGSPVNMSGGSARWWMGKSASSVGDKVFIKKGVGSGLTLTLIDDVWTAQIVIDPADTQGLKPGDNYHELEVVDGAGAVSTVTVGTFSINQTMIPSV